MQIDPDATRMSAIMEEDALRKQFQEFDPTNEKVLALAPKKVLEKLKADLRKAGYKTDNRHFRK